MPSWAGLFKYFTCEDSREPNLHCYNYIPISTKLGRVSENDMHQDYYDEIYWCLQAVEFAECKIRPIAVAEAGYC